MRTTTSTTQHSPKVDAGPGWKAAKWTLGIYVPCVVISVILTMIGSNTEPSTTSLPALDVGDDEAIIAVIFAILVAALLYAAFYLSFYRQSKQHNLR